MKKFQNTLNVAIILSETSHIFCCVLPTIFSVLSLLAGIGLVGAMPFWLQDLHATLHHWELPIITLSGLIIVLGWALHAYSEKVDCHDTGCHHGPCEPNKKKATTILKIATVLFIVNISVYLVFHRGMEIFVPSDTVVTQEHVHDHDHSGHDH